MYLIYICYMNKISKIINIILIATIPLFIVFILVFSVLGFKTRVGYLSNFNLNVAETLELYNLKKIDSVIIGEFVEVFDEEGSFDYLFSLAGKRLNVYHKGLVNYLLTNDNITNYVYDFKIGYYDKVFKHSDIYGVYPDLSNLPEYIKNIEMGHKGSPFGSFISDRIINEEKIENIEYILKIKLKLIIYYILIICIIFILVNNLIGKLKLISYKYIKNIKQFLLGDKYKKYIFIVFFILSLIFMIIFIINNKLSKKEYTSILSDLSLITQSSAGYVYKAKVNFDNSLFKIKDGSIRFADTNIIINYGSTIKITNKPDISLYGDDMYYMKNNTFIINNKSDISGYKYNLQIPRYIDDRYKITICAKQIPNNGTIEWYLNNSHSSFKPIENSEVSNDYIILTATETVLNKSSGNSELQFIFPNGIIEIESILLENINNKLNLIEDNYIVFTSSDNIEALNNFGIKYNIEFKYSLYAFFLIIFANSIFCLLWIILLIKLKSQLNSNNILYVFILVLLFDFINITNYIKSDSEGFIIFFIISFIASILFFIFNFMAEKKAIKLEKIFLLNFIIISVLYILILPPMEAPDEGSHYTRAYDISKGIIIDKDGSYLPSEIKMFSKRIDSYSDIFYNIKMNISSKNEFIRNSAWTYSPVSYFPQCIGMLFARLLHIQDYLEIYFARLFALIFACFSMYLSIKYLPFKKTTLYFICFLPMVISQTVSFSADSVLIWASLSYISLILYLKYSKNNFLSFNNYLLISFLCLIIFLSKNVYLFLFALLFLIPKDKFKINKYISMFIIFIFIFILYFIWNRANNLGEYVSTVHDSELNKNFIIHNPLKYFIIFLNTIYVKGNFYFSTMIGSGLGYNDISIGNLYYLFVLLFIMLLLFDYDDRIKIDIKLFSFIIFSIIFTMILTALYLVYTPHDYMYIEGVQGRYFIPILFLLFITLNFKYFKLKLNLKNKSLFLTISMLNLGVLYEIFNRLY